MTVKSPGHLVAGAGVIALLVLAAGGLMSLAPPMVPSETSHNATYTTVGKFHVRVNLAPGDETRVVLPCADNQTGTNAIGQVWRQSSDEIRYVVNFMLSSHVSAEVSQAPVTSVTWKESANRSDSEGKEWGVGGGGNLTNAYFSAGILLVDEEVTCPQLAEAEPIYLVFDVTLNMAGGGYREVTTDVAITKDASTMQSRFAWEVTAACPLPPCLE